MHFRRRIPWLPLWIGTSLAIGFIVPSVYEWTQKPAARHRHYAMERGAFTVATVTISVCLLTAWLRSGQTTQRIEREKSRRLQFGLRGVFAATTLTAAALAIARFLGMPVGSGVVAAAALTVAAWGFARGDGRLRSRITVLLASMFLPFTWMIAYNVPFGFSTGLAVNIPLGPGIFFSTQVGQLIGWNPDEATMIAAAIVPLKLLTGALLARRGRRLWQAYHVFVFISSSLSSLALHALYRF